MNFARILFATDLSESSTRALDFALDLAHVLQADVVAVHTLDKRMISSVEEAVEAELHDRARKQAQQKLAMISTEGGRHGVDVSAVLTEGIAADEILKTAEDVDADLILLATTHKGAIERVLIGATAERVVRESRVPVLCVPAKTHSLPQAVGKTS